MPIKRNHALNHDFEFYKTTPSQLNSTINQSSVDSLYDTVGVQSIKVDRTLSNSKFKSNQK